MEFDYKKRILHVYILLGVLVLSLFVFVICYSVIFLNANNLIDKLGASYYLFEEVNVKGMFVGGGMGGEVEINSYFNSYFRYLDENGDSVITYLNSQIYFDFNALVYNLVNYISTFAIIGLITCLICLCYAVVCNCYKMHIVVSLIAFSYVFWTLKLLNQTYYLISLLMMIGAIGYVGYQLFHIYKTTDSKKNKNIIVMIKA